MSNTSNFDFCVETSIDVTREIFHLAFKNEELFPHNIGPLTRPLGGLTAQVSVVVLDDETRPADLSFEDESTSGSASPTTSPSRSPRRRTRPCRGSRSSSTASFLGRLDTWDDDAGEPVLGVTFADVTAADVTVEGLTGLPAIGSQQLENAIHAKYPLLQHRYTAPANGGTAELLLYDGTRDASLVPPHPTARAITAALEMNGADEFLKVVVPIHVDVPTGFGFDYESFGIVTFWRRVTRTDTTITVDMSVEPAQPRVGIARGETVENFFTDNPDILWHFDHLDLDDIIRSREDDFEQAKAFPDAPRTIAEAREGYRAVLEEVGAISCREIAPLAPEVDAEGAHYDHGKVSYAAGTQRALDILAQTDLMGFTLPRRYGGLNLPGVLYTLATEMVSRADAQPDEHLRAPGHRRDDQPVRR